jgi:hypothetical protein
MTHATPEQIHDHVFGFLRSDHVETCAACGRAANVVAEEIGALRDVLHAPPASRRRFGPASLAAAALLLAALASLLIHRRPEDRIPAAAVPQEQDDEMVRLVAEFKGTSPVRRDIARLALKQYGGTAVEAMTRAQIDPQFLDEVQGISPEDRKILDRLKSTRITLNLEKVVYTDVFCQLSEAVGVTPKEVPGLELETAFMSFQVDNVTVQEAFQKFCDQVKQPFGGVQFGRIVIGRRRSPSSFSPVRLPAKPEDVARRIGQLSDDVPARREEAAMALRRLGFGAEKALWKALDSDSVETRSRAADLLRLLYTATNHDMEVPAGWRSWPRITVDCENRPMEEVLTGMVDQVGGSLIRDSRIALGNEQITFKVQDIVLDSAVRLLLGARGMTGFASPDCVLIAPEGAAQAWTGRPHARWAESGEARALEARIADLASSDPARHEKAAQEFKRQDGQAALDVLAYAVGALEGDALARAQRLRRTIAENMGLWIQDVPSGADLQKLTPAQSAVLDGRVTRPGRPMTIEEILKADGVRCKLDAEPSASYHLAGSAPKRSSLLKIVLRPRGLDFYMDGETLVIDTAANVRAAVEGDK